MKIISTCLSAVFLFIQVSVSQQIYVASAKSKGIEQFLNENRVSTAFFVYENSFVTANKFDKSKLVDFINQNIPNPNATGIAVLDCEGPAYKKLFSSSLKLREESISMFIDVIKTAKKMRPKMRWSFYSIPSREFYNLDSSWKNSNIKLAKLISELDFIAPSIYILFGDSEISRERTKEYFDGNIKFSLELGRKYSKEVMPIVWHRYHPWNKKFGDQLIPAPVFADYISMMQNIKYGNRGISGIIWWHSEEYNYRMRSTNRIYSDEYRNKDKDEVQYEIFNTYYKEIKRKLR
ncbi:hypothetical protein ACR79N_08015 [Sphingobacterium siyangense]|uniref:hypothetical protein n=1 Tax=Sphingobacterium siyangense TaxID=459529 RepID=UPI003DA2342E